jgi:hypothetical protein
VAGETTELVEPLSSKAFAEAQKRNALAARSKLKPIHTRLEDVSALLVSPNRRRQSKSLFPHPPFFSSFLRILSDAAVDPILLVGQRPRTLGDGLLLEDLSHVSFSFLFFSFALGPWLRVCFQVALAQGTDGRRRLFESRFHLFACCLVPSQSRLRVSMPAY